MVFDEYVDDFGPVGALNRAWNIVGECSTSDELEVRLDQLLTAIKPKPLIGGFPGPIDEDAGGYASVARMYLEDWT